jgi:hypothetical protein
MNKKKIKKKKNMLDNNNNKKKRKNWRQDQEAVVGDSILFINMATDFSEIEIRFKIF